MAKISPVPHKKSHIQVYVSESLDLDVHCTLCLQWSFSVFVLLSKSPMTSYNLSSAS